MRALNSLVIESSFYVGHISGIVLRWFRHMKPTKTLHAFDSVAFGLLEANFWLERLGLL